HLCVERFELRRAHVGLLGLTLPSMIGVSAQGFRHELVSRSRLAVELDGDAAELYAVVIVPFAVILASFPEVPLRELRVLFLLLLRLGLRELAAPVQIF